MQQRSTVVREVLAACAWSVMLASSAWASDGGNRGAVQTAVTSAAAEDWTAGWIAAPWSTERDGSSLDDSKPMPVFRRVFMARERPVAATLRIAGLGQYRAEINGTDDVAPAGLHEAWTDYRKSVVYDSYDVTARVTAGENTLTVLLGNGMYNVQRADGRKRYTKLVGSFGVPTLTAELRLRYADGTTEVIATDGAWRVAAGPVLFSSTYGGEDYDGRWSAASAAWQPVASVGGPGGRMIAAIAPPVRVLQTYAPIRVTQPVAGKTVYDLGQNFAGWPQITVQGPAGAVLRMTPGELLEADGTVSQLSSKGPQWWSYTLGDGARQQWSPRFSYYGFRYLQVEWSGAAGKVLAVRGLGVHSDSAVTGSFASSSEMLNRIHAMIVEAMHNNEVSLFTDCPHREKLGWLEEVHLIAPGLLYNSDLRGLFDATAHNIADEQRGDGMVPTTAPQYVVFPSNGGVFNDSPEWGSTTILAPWWQYRFYGETAQLAANYAVMQRYIAYLQSKAQDGIVNYGLGDWYDIGPGAPGFEKNTSLGVTGTIMLLDDAMAMQQIALLLGHGDDAARYAALVAAEKAAFNRRFWNEHAGYYDTGSQTANAMPLALGVVPAERREAVLAHLVADIHAHQDHVTTGEVGYPYLLRALTAAGRDDVVLAMLLRTDPPSYGSQLAAGATALTEAWDANPKSSQDHFMLGGAEEWFYRALGGIDLDQSRADPATRITIRPKVLAGVGWVRCGYRSEAGAIESDWRREGQRTTMEVTIPAGATATVMVPGTQAVTARSRSAAGGSITRVGREGNSTVYRVGGGRYRFAASE